jgi:hypothetical protein
MTKLFLIIAIPLLLSSPVVSQNVGIGTSNPAFKLDVQGRMRIKAATAGQLTSTSGVWMDDYRDGTNRFFFGMKDSIRAGFYGSGAGGTGWDFTFNTQNGNIGIGYLDPASFKLSIDGEVGLYRTTQSGLNLYGSLAYNTGSLVINAKQGNLITNTSPEDIILQHGFGALAVTSGKVGIGTSTLTAKLHVNGDVMIGSGLPANGYMLSVKGKIMSEELKVQLQSNWPDYVFGDDYRLMSLDDLRKFVSERHHLPNIPAATELEKNGVEVGEMQRRMMEKIEELTLYVLQLEDQIKELRKSR